MTDQIEASTLQQASKVATQPADLAALKIKSSDLRAPKDTKADSSQATSFPTNLAALKEEHPEFHQFLMESNFMSFVHQNNDFQKRIKEINREGRR